MIPAVLNGLVSTGQSPAKLIHCKHPFSILYDCYLCDNSNFNLFFFNFTLIILYLLEFLPNVKYLKPIKIIIDVDFNPHSVCMSATFHIG